VAQKHVEDTALARPAEIEAHDGREISRQAETDSTARADYHNLLGNSGRLILAGRLTYVMQFGDVPFYSAPVIPFTDGDADGLGGHATLRGFVTDRFVGRAATYANGELRWSFDERVLWNQHLRFMLVPFIDAGRV